MRTPWSPWQNPLISSAKDIKGFSSSRQRGRSPCVAWGGLSPREALREPPLFLPPLASKELSLTFLAASRGPSMLGWGVVVPPNRALTLRRGEACKYGDCGVGCAAGLPWSTLLGCTGGSSGAWCCCCC